MNTPFDLASYFSFLLFLPVLGDFEPGSRAENDARNHPTTLHKGNTIECPKRSYTYPSIVEWGSVPAADNAKARIKRIPLSNRVFYGQDGKLHFANVIQEDVDLINNDYRGIQCLLSVGLAIRASRRFKLRVDRVFRKCLSFHSILLYLTGLLVHLDVTLHGQTHFDNNISLKHLSLPIA